MKSEQTLRRELQKVKAILRAARGRQAVEAAAIQQALEWALGEDAMAPHPYLMIDAGEGVPA